MKFSIIIPIYNRQNFIIETLNSLINQTYKNWEAIVIDDGSTDNSFQEAKKLAKKDTRIKVLKRNRLPKGANTCRNIGIKKASGDYLIFLDSDDLLKPFALYQRAKMINEYPDKDYLVFQTVNFENTYLNEQEVWNIETNENPKNRFLKLDSVWHTAAPVWKKQTVLNNNLFFDEKLNCWQDVDFHLQALFKNLKYKVFFNMPADVLYRRHSTGSISQGGFNKEKRKSQVYFVKKYYDIVENKEQKEILKKLTYHLAIKNAQSKYLLNLSNLLFWALLNKILKAKQVFYVVKSIFLNKSV